MHYNCGMVEIGSHFDATFTIRIGLSPAMSAIVDSLPSFLVTVKSRMLDDAAAMIRIYL